MADNSLKLEIVTPDSTVYSGDVKSVKAPGEAGYFQILKNHTSFLSTIDVGEIKVETEGKTMFFATSGGFLEVLNNVVSVLAETAEDVEAIDLERAQASKERAEKRIAGKESGTDFFRAKLAVIRAINRIKISSKK